MNDLEALKRLAQQAERDHEPGMEDARSRLDATMRAEQAAGSKAHRTAFAPFAELRRRWSMPRVALNAAIAGLFIVLSVTTLTLDDRPRSVDADNLASRTLKATALNAARQPVKAGGGVQRVVERAGSPLKTPLVALFTPAELKRLPTEPKRLRKVLTARLTEVALKSPDRLPASSEQAIFAAIAGLLRESSASPELRSALFLVVAGLDGVAVEDDARDLAGRSGTAFLLTDRGIEQAIIVEPDSTEVIGSTRRVADPKKLPAPLRKPGQRPGTVLDAESYDPAPAANAGGESESAADSDGAAAP